MIKLKLLIGFLFVNLVTVNAQECNENKFFNHLSIGVSVGTTGLGIDIAAPLNNYFQVRGGFDMMLNFTVGSSLDISSYSIPEKVYEYIDNIPSSIDGEFKTLMKNTKILVDFYPFKRSNFHITAGTYIGSSGILEVYNKEDGSLKSIYDANILIDEWNKENPNNRIENIGIELGKYFLTPDNKGNFNASIKTNSFKPYIGIGFGRAVPRKRVGFMMDMGVMFWGKPSIYCNGIELKEQNFDGDSEEIVKTLYKITAYPVINFRLCGRIF